MECAVDAQSLISISLMKIHKSRTQRGGIKLHRNLLVSCVLRNARQVYIREKYAEIYRMQQYEEVRTVCDGIRELDPEDPDPEDPEEEALPVCAPLQDPEAPFYRSCCMEPPGSPYDPLPGNGVRCSQTTVLDLDTHVVTTVEDGFLHQDCCCAAPQCAPPDSDSPVRKRKGDFGGRASDPEEVSDFTASRKRVKREPNPEHADVSNISNLISIFGSGFSGLLSRQADLDQVCSKQALAGLGAWTRAIVAF